jgi:hypothetical protein
MEGDVGFHPEGGLRPTGAVGAHVAVVAEGGFHPGGRALPDRSGWEPPGAAPDDDVERGPRAEARRAVFRAPSL